MPIEPTEAQLAELTSIDQARPISMLNLLKFKPTACYADGRDKELPGRDAYMRYALEVTGMIQALGGEITHASQATTLVIGDGDLQWDMVSIVNYPSTRAFLEMVESEAYAKIRVHRDAGLDSQLLIQCQ